MASVAWTPLARRDLQSVEDFIARDSPDQAVAFVEKLSAAALRLAEFPLLGKVIESLDLEEMRGLLFHDYRILYRVHGQTAVIHAIVHGSMDLDGVATRRGWKKT